MKNIEEQFGMKISDLITEQRKLISDKREKLLVFGYKGGLFDATPELIATIKVFIDYNRTDVIFLDKHNTPILVEKPSNFLEDCLNKYSKATNELYLLENKLKEYINIYESL